MALWAQAMMSGKLLKPDAIAQAWTPARLRPREVVMKHYFRPGREDFRAAIFKAMPKMLADGGQKSAKKQLREIAERMTAKPL